MSTKCYLHAHRLLMRISCDKLGVNVSKWSVSDGQKVMVSNGRLLLANHKSAVKQHNGCY